MTILDAAVWSQVISVPRLRLVRRDASHADFLVALWSEPKFGMLYNRLENFNESVSRVGERLGYEREVPLAQSRNCHWVIESHTGQGLGILSLVDISELHKRAEVLIGVSALATHGTATAAMLICFQFFFKVIHFKKLYSFVYPDNLHSIRSTLALGFEQEGYFKSHLIDPNTGNRHDLIQMGLLPEKAFNARNLKLMKRLLR
jgi:RimJ/RimL family protein N-acetyltransferase